MLKKIWVKSILPFLKNNVYAQVRLRFDEKLELNIKVKIAGFTIWTYNRSFSKEERGGVPKWEATIDREQVIKHS